MTNAVRGIALTGVGMALILALHLLQNNLDRQRAASPRLQRFLYLPQGETLRVAALGYDQVVADLLWIEAIQAMGERKISAEAGRWIAHAIDVITTLDPHFVRVYEAGGIALATLVPMFEESNRLLEKGMRHNPQVWQLPFHLGFNYYFNFNDDPKAARYMAIASRLPGAPPYLAQLAARLYVSAKSPQLAIDFLAQMYDKTTDRNVKRVLEQRLKEVMVERDLLMLEEAIGRYRALHKRVPDRLEDLVSSGVVRELPREPFGGRYLYDPRAGAVRSSVVKERMKLYGRRMSS